MAIASTPQNGKQNSDLNNALRSAKGEITLLRQELDRTTLVVQAMWELLKKKHGETEEDLLHMIDAVDLLDGKLDGKPSRLPENCPDCTRPVSVVTNTCFFCGTEVKRVKVF